MEQQKTEAEIELEIEQLKKITRHDGDKKYAEAQFKLASIYYLYKKDLRQVIAHLLNIEEQDNPQIYTKAQFNLGFIYQEELRDLEQAKKFFLNIKKEHNLKIYSQAQLNLGFIYQIEKRDISLTIDCYLNVEKKGNPKAYAYAQFYLGYIYQFNKNNIEDAEKYYSNVEKKGNPKAYAYAQFYLGFIYQINKSNVEVAEKYYSNVKKKYNPEAYAYAQFYLGDIYQNNKNKIEEAERYYLNVEKQDNPVAYANAQIKLGDNIFFDKTENKLKLAEEYYQNVAYFDESFKSYIIAQIMLSVISNKNSSIFEEEQRNNLVIKIFDIRKLTIEIQEELLVKFNLNESENNDGLVFEREVAHYTKPEVLFNLLKNKPSDFRLNVVDFMNDPTENQVLTDWLGVKTEKDNEIKTFLASFSFNHNSLNQFRLYGNENNIVGSSVSLVFNKKFFGDDINRSINPASINYFFNNADFGLARNDSAKSVVATMGLNNSNENLNQKNDKIGNDLNENLDPKNSETIAEKNIISSVGSLPLFRCLYFDPKNDYISIAKRNKYSFYLEYQNSHDLNVYNKWKAYLNSLKQTKKINTIRKKLKEIEKIVYLLKNPENPQQKEIIEKIGKIVYSLKNSKNPKPKEIIEKIEKIVYLLKNSKNPEPKEIIEKIEKIIYLLKNSKNPELKEIIEKLVDSLKNPEEPKQKEIIEKITNLDQLIALALMPISCLVKHAAFEDEDECRMIYITNIADELIQAPTNYAYANSLFVNYGKIEDYLEKIYLGPQCQPHHKLWITNHVRTSQSKTRSKPIKVVQSEMPLR